MWDQNVDNRIMKTFSSLTVFPTSKIFGFKPLVVSISQRRCHHLPQFIISRSKQGVVPVCLEVGGSLGSDMGWPVAGACKCINRARAVAAPWDNFLGSLVFKCGEGPVAEVMSAGMGVDLRKQKES